MVEQRIVASASASLAVTPLRETPPPLPEALPCALAPEEALLAGRARAVLIIPSRFERDLPRGLPTEALH
jgi:hypothetical protein